MPGAQTRRFVEDLGSTYLSPAPSRSSALSQRQQTCRSRLALFAHHVAAVAEPCKHVQSHFSGSDPLRAPPRVADAPASIPPHSAPPRLRTGARHPLFTPQPRPLGRRAGKGAGREQASWAQLRTRRSQAAVPALDAPDAGQIQDVFSGPRGPGCSGEGSPRDLVAAECAPAPPQGIPA